MSRQRRTTTEEPEIALQDRQSVAKRGVNVPSSLQVVGTSFFWEDTFQILEHLIIELF
jgi:hypothetical protein